MDGIQNAVIILHHFFANKMIVTVLYVDTDMCFQSFMTTCLRRQCKAIRTGENIT